MGLDVSGYSHIEIRSLVDQYDEDFEDHESVHQDYINNDFTHTVPADWQGKEYVLWRKTDESEDVHFRAGSYGGYNLWRSGLAHYAFEFPARDSLHVNRDLWDTVVEAEGKPFFELINFSDCEGVFYGPVCEKLYVDFYAHRDNYIDSVDADVYDIERYDYWMKAFDLDKDNGLVKLH
jgi:hypothetical protein